MKHDEESLKKNFFDLNHLKKDDKISFHRFLRIFIPKKYMINYFNIPNTGYDENVVYYVNHI